MTSLFPNDFSNDAVDKLNYKWMVLGFLSLSLFSFIVPLHPSLNKQPTQTIYTNTQAKETTDKLAMFPKFDVICWCPAEFTQELVKYGNTHCKNAFTAMLMKEEGNRDIFFISNSDIPFHASERMNQMEQDSRKQNYLEPKLKERKRFLEAEELPPRVQKLLTFQVPVLLLIVAICLLLPQMIWSFLSDCCSPFNIGEILEAAKKGNEILSSVKRSLRRTNKTASVLYLFKKLLSFVVVLALLIVTYQQVFTDVEELDNELNSDKTSPVSNFSSNSTHEWDAFTSNFSPFFCGFRIKQFDQSQLWTLQCILKVDEENYESGISTTSTTINYQYDNEKKLAEFERTIITIAMTLLFILLLSNGLNLFIWLYKLIPSSSRELVNLSNDTAMDLVLLVQMARINTNASVMQMLACRKNQDS